MNAGRSVTDVIKPAPMGAYQYGNPSLAASRASVVTQSIQHANGSVRQGTRWRYGVAEVVSWRPVGLQYACLCIGDVVVTHV